MINMYARYNNSRKILYAQVRGTLFLSNSRKVILLLRLLLFALTLAGCNNVPACPSGGNDGGCTGG
jgi:hypothetical protein